MGFEGALTVTLKKSWHKKLFVVKEPLVFQGKDARVEVPIGFETDLASIPWWARWAIPKAHSNAYAAVVHDFCYDTNFTTRKHADELFFEALSDPVCNTRIITRWVMWVAVRVGGRRGWKRARKNDQHLKLVSLFGKTPNQMKLLEGPKMRKFKEFNEFEKPERIVKQVFLHCSDHDNLAFDTPEEIDRWHKARGWSGIGYHFYIDKNGRIFHGRNINRIPAAQAPFNRRSIAICCGGKDVNKFTMAQFESLRRLCREIDAAYDGEMVFRGHCEVSPKTCPVFDYKRVLRLDENGRIKDGVPTIKKLEASNSEHMKAAKKQETKGDVAVAVGGSALATGAVEEAKDPENALTTLKELTSKGLEYKALIKTGSELLSWAATWEGIMMIGGAWVLYWGWTEWRDAKKLKEARLKEEPKLKRLEREALAENS